MKSSSRLSLMTTMMSLVFIFSAVVTAPVYADDSVPPPTDTPTEVTPPVDSTTPTVSVVSTDSAPLVADIAPTDSAPVDIVPTDPAPVADTAADILVQVPADSQVVIVNAQGDALPLASEAAAQTIIDGDPMWCPMGVAPGAATCSPSYGYIGSNTHTGGLWSWLDTNDPAKAGVIWVAYNYNGALEAGTPANLNGSYFDNLDNFALTVQGGWNGTTGSTALNTTTPYSTFTVPLWIWNSWTGAITLKNIVVDDSSTPVTIGADDYALFIASAGSLTLDTVKVQNNWDLVNLLSGASLNNTSSTTAATVTIKNSSFDGNEGRGLVILSDGIVTISNISANGNLGGDGASIDNRTLSTDKAVTITGIQQFNNNTSGYGLKIYSDGAITLANLVANNNTGSGVSLDNRTSSGNLGVTIKGVNQLNNNNANGLAVLSHGVITLNSITAINNGWSGVHLDNSAGASFPKAVTLTGTNIFNGNGTVFASAGLEVYSHGAITVSNVTASNNFVAATYGGIFLNNNFTGAVGGITINGYGTFEHNTGYGLQIISSGAVLLNNINANVNLYGALTDNCGPNFSSGSYPTCANVKPLTLKGTNNFNGNTNYGLEALSGGALTASNLTANGNGWGESFYDSVNANAPTIGNALLVGRSSLTLTGVNTFNDDTVYVGLWAASSGKVAINNLNANGNAATGAYVSGGGPSVALILSGVNTFNNNGGSGLYSDQNYGAVTLSNVTANGNFSYGALIENDYVNTTPWTVTLLGTNQFNENDLTGLIIETYGAVLLNNITANFSAGHSSGLIVTNNAGLPTLPKPITLTGFNNFNNNTETGLRLYSIGIITLNNITANNNYTSTSGAYIQNDFLAASAASPGVFINGVNSFSNNVGGTGLEIQTKGAITLNNIDASNNSGFGAYLVNSSGLLKAVTISGVNNFNSNKYSGLYIAASGVVTLSRITANNNDPTNLYSTAGINVTTVKNIYLTCGYTYNNGYYGTYLNSTGGTVTVKGLYSFSNGTTNVAISSFLPSLAINYPCALP